MADALHDDGPIDPLALAEALAVPLGGARCSDDRWARYRGDEPMMRSIRAALGGAASALKMSAGRLRGSGPGGPAAAAAALREAARLEGELLAACEPTDDVTRLRSAVEQCGLLLEAGDVDVVLGEAWPRVVALADVVGDECAASALQRLAPAVARLRARQP